MGMRVPFLKKKYVRIFLILLLQLCVSACEWPSYTKLTVTSFADDPGFDSSLDSNKITQLSSLAYYWASTGLTLQCLNASGSWIYIGNSTVATNAGGGLHNFNSNYPDRVVYQHTWQGSLITQAAANCSVTSTVVSTVRTNAWTYTHYQKALTLRAIDPNGYVTPNYSDAERACFGNDPSPDFWQRHTDCNNSANDASYLQPFDEIITRVSNGGSSTPTGTITYFHNDNSGSPIVATDANGNVVWKENYRPFGDKLNNQAASSNNKLWFTGKPYDSVSGLSYMGARYYDPLMGRFVGIDPQGFNPDNIQSFNRYTYANNNPYKFVDPDGHSPIDVAFLAYDVGKLSVALYTGDGIGVAAADVALSTVGVVSPLPFAGEALKAARAVEHGVELAKTADHAEDAVRSTKELRGGLFKSSKADAIKQAGGKCEYCGKGGATQGDHAKTLNTYKNEVNEGKLTKEQAKAEANSPSNIVSSCKQCNEVDKHTKDLGTGAGEYTPPNPSDRVKEMMR
jgi:RHS repeat-associated protein